MNHLPPVVGFSGFAGSGKNTAALAVVEHGYVEDSFAVTLKQMAFALDPIVGCEYCDGFHEVRLSRIVELEGWEKAKADPEVRRTLQRLGTEAGRHILGDDIWIETLLGRISHRLACEKRMTVVTDVRFANEAQLIQEHYTFDHLDRWKSYCARGLLIWIDRPGNLPPNNHVSESKVCREMADAIIVNNGTVEELHTKVLEAVGVVV